MARKIECRHCGTFNCAGTVCRCQQREKQVFSMKKLRVELDKVVYLMESGNEFDSMLHLKALQLVLSAVDECR